MAPSSAATRRWAMLSSRFPRICSIMPSRKLVTLRRSPADGERCPAERPPVRAPVAGVWAGTAAAPPGPRSSRGAEEPEPPRARRTGYRRTSCTGAAALAARASHRGARGSDGAGKLRLGCHRPAPKHAVTGRQSARDPGLPQRRLPDPGVALEHQRGGPGALGDKRPENRELMLASNHGRRPVNHVCIVPGTRPRPFGG